MAGPAGVDDPEAETDVETNPEADAEVGEAAPTGAAESRPPLLQPASTAAQTAADTAASTTEETVGMAIREPPLPTVHWLGSGPGIIVEVSSNRRAPYATHAPASCPADT